MVEKLCSGEQIEVGNWRLVIVSEPERETILKKGIFCDRALPGVRRQLSARALEPLAKLSSLLRKLDWTEVVVFSLEPLLKGLGDLEVVIFRAFAAVVKAAEISCAAPSEAFSSGWDNLADVGLDSRPLAFPRCAVAGLEAPAPPSVVHLPW